MKRLSGFEHGGEVWVVCSDGDGKPIIKAGRFIRGVIDGASIDGMSGVIDGGTLTAIVLFSSDELAVPLSNTYVDLESAESLKRSIEDYDTARCGWGPYFNPGTADDMTKGWEKTDAYSNAGVPSAPAPSPES